MNTRFNYLYRDACNYKQHSDVVISGILDGAAILPFLHEGPYFIPAEIGLPELQTEPFTVDDHIWHEFVCVEPTDEPATVERDAEAFLEAVREASARGWNEEGAFRRWGIIP